MVSSYGVIGAPTSAGSYAPGQEKTPHALRAAGFLSSLAENGSEVVDLTDTQGFRWTPDRNRPDAMHVDVCARIANAVAARVTQSWNEGHTAIVLGGDCTIEMGVVSAAVKSGSNFGLIYIDGDADMRTPAVTTDGALDWMGVAHMLDLPGCEPALTRLGDRLPLLEADQLLLFGTWNIKQDERDWIEKLDIALIDEAEVCDHPATAAAKAIDWAGKFDKLLVHVDVDVLDFEDFPLAENTRRKAGLTWEQLKSALRPLLSADNLAAVTICEVNPDHGASDGATLKKFTEDMVAIFACREQAYS